MVLTTAHLEKMSQQELDELYRASPAGEIPRGEGRGTILFAPGTEITETAARLVHLFGWKGKIFDPERGELRNQILPIGLKAVVAKVYQGESWFDGKETIVLDYSHTSLIAHWVRDELRQIGPGLYLGIAFWRRVKVVDFALEFPA
jgi:hypothetical protein